MDVKCDDAVGDVECGTSKQLFGVQLRLQDYVGLVFLVHEALKPPSEGRHVKTTTKKSGVILALVSKFPKMDRDNLKRFRGEIRSQSVEKLPLKLDPKGNPEEETIKIPGKYNPKTHELYRRLNLPFVESLLNDEFIRTVKKNRRKLVEDLVPVLNYIASFSKVRTKYVYLDGTFDTLKDAKARAIQNPVLGAIIYKVTERYVEDDDYFDTIVTSLRGTAKTCMKKLNTALIPNPSKIQTKMKLEILLDTIKKLNSEDDVFVEERVGTHKITEKKLKKKTKLELKSVEGKCLREDLLKRLKDLPSIEELTGPVQAILNKPMPFDKLTPANLAKAEEARRSDPEEIISLLQIRSNAQQSLKNATLLEGFLKVLDDIICFVQSSQCYKPDLKPLITNLEKRDHLEYIESYKIVKNREGEVTKDLKLLLNEGSSVEEDQYNDKVDAFVEAADPAKLDDLIKASYTFLYESLKLKNAALEKWEIQENRLSDTARKARDKAYSTFTKLQVEEQGRRRIIEGLEKRIHPNWKSTLPPDYYVVSFGFSFGKSGEKRGSSKQDGNKKKRNKKSANKKKGTRGAAASSPSADGAGGADSGDGAGKRPANNQGGKKKKRARGAAPAPAAPANPKTISWFLNTPGTTSIQKLTDKKVLLEAGFDHDKSNISKEEKKLKKRNLLPTERNDLRNEIEGMKKKLRLEGDEVIRIQLELAKKKFDTSLFDLEQVGKGSLKGVLGALEKYMTKMQEFNKRWFLGSVESTRRNLTSPFERVERSSDLEMREKHNWSLQKDSWKEVWKNLCDIKKKVKHDLQDEANAAAAAVATEKRKATKLQMAQVAAKRQKIADGLPTAPFLTDLSGLVWKILSLLEVKLIGRDKRVVVKTYFTSVLLVNILNSNPNEYGSFKEVLNKIINGIIRQICVGRRNNDVWKQVVKQLIDICLDKLAEPLPPGTTYASRVIDQSRRRGGGAQTLEEKLQELLDKEKNAV